jgi:hypothetical protein
MRLIVVLIMASCSVAKEKRVTRIYDTVFGSVICSETFREPCGVTLKECDDHSTYRCLINIREHAQ